MGQFTHLVQKSAFLDLRQDMMDCRRELTEKHARLSAKLPKRHTDPVFDKKILSYVNSLRAMRKKYKATIEELAGKIEGLCAQRPDWGNDPVIVGLWYELADVARTFSFNVDKKNASLLIDGRGKLMTWGVSRTPKGLPRRADCFKKGKRSRFNLCAEALVLANINRQEVAICADVDLEVMAREVQLLKRRGMDADEIRHSRAAARLGTETTGLYIVATTPPCEECSRAIVANYEVGVVAGLITTGHLPKAQRADYTRDIKVHRRIANRVPTHRVRVCKDNQDGVFPNRPLYCGYFATKKWGQYWQGKLIKPLGRRQAVRLALAAQ